MNYLFLLNCAVKVISTKVESYLCNLFPQSDPVSLYVVKVVKKYPRNGYRFQVINRGSAVPPESRSFRPVGEGNEDLKTARFILNFPEFCHVLNPFLNGLNVAVKHRRVGRNSKPVGGPVNLKILLCIRFIGRNYHPCSLRKDLSSSTRNGIKARINEVCQNLLIGLSRDLCHVMDLNGGPRFNHHLGKVFLYKPDKVNVLFIIPVVWNPADHVDLPATHPEGFLNLFKNLLIAHLIGLGVRFPDTKGTEVTLIDTYICRIDLAVNYKVGSVSIFLPVYMLGQDSEEGKVRLLKKDHRLFLIYPLSLKDLFPNTPERSIFNRRYNSLNISYHSLPPLEF